MAKKLKTFNDVIGHTNIINYMKARVQEDNVADVAIFYGESGLGKSSIAKILAIEVATRHNPELKEEYIKAVIENNRSTDSIKLFNMSEIQDKEEEIQKVKAELNTSFSSTGRKILVLDEGHGMTKKAQDSILTEIEHMPKGVYVFICTTEYNALRPALQSRCKTPFALRRLSDREAKQVAINTISERNLTFNISEGTVIAMACSWAENQPRKICNLFENFAIGSVVKASDLEVFINVSTSAALIELLKYLYGSMTLGIDYLSSMKYDEAFVMMLVEVCKVALGHNSSALSKQDVAYVHDFMKDKDSMHIMKFTAEVCGLSELRKRRIISAFMKSHVAFKSAPPVRQTEQSQMEDFKTLSDNIEDTSVVMYDAKTKEVRVPSLDELFAGADVIE